MPIYDIEEEDIEVISNCLLCDSNSIEVISEVCEKDKKKLITIRYSPDTCRNTLQIKIVENVKTP